MNAKRKLFCHEYIIDLNATQAAIRAGYSKSRARITASELMQNEEVQNRIIAMQKEITIRNNITIDGIVKELEVIGFSNLSECFDENGAVKDLKEIPVNTQKAISSIKSTELFNKKGELIGYNKEIKFNDKLSALDKLMKHLGGYQKDNEQKPIINLEQITGMVIK